MASKQWPEWRFEATAARSVAVHGNRGVLPAAGWIFEAGLNAITAPEVSRGLNGHLPPNKALEALVRISHIGALREMPHPGRPSARVFSREPAAYWDFVAAELAQLGAAADGVRHE